jgi:hypothetical protein
MYRKTLIALACAVISAPAFAQYVPPLSGDGLPPCELTNHRAPCSYLDFQHTPPNIFPPNIDVNPTPPLAPRSDSTTASDTGYGPNPQQPSSPDVFHNWRPTWNNGIPGVEIGPGTSYPRSQR